jgi:hypothetical protein
MARAFGSVNVAARSGTMAGAGKAGAGSGTNA